VQVSTHTRDADAAHAFVLLSWCQCVAAHFFPGMHSLTIRQAVLSIVSRCPAMLQIPSDPRRDCVIKGHVHVHSSALQKVPYSFFPMRCSAKPDGTV
jgi:hypothetical protein